MKNSSMVVFSFFTNVKKMIESEKENTSGIFKVNTFHFYNSRDYSKKIAKRIYNELENHIYTYKDLLVHLLYMYAFNETILFHKINIKEVKKTLKVFTKKQLKIDMDFITQMNETLKLKNVCELFEIKENGEPIIYELIKQNYITPVIFVNLYEKLLTIKNKDVILKSSNYKKFEYAMKFIIKILKGGLDEQKEICN